MGKMEEYIAEGTGLNADHTPASSIQFVFGQGPFMMSETDDINDVIKINKVYQSDAVASIRLLDDVAMVSFDFSADTSILKELTDEINIYLEKRDQLEDVLYELTTAYDLALDNEDEDTAGEIQLQLQAVQIPFLATKLFPVVYKDTVQISFDDDPKFVFITADSLDKLPAKITMIYDAHDVYCQDSSALYHIDDSDDE